MATTLRACLLLLASAAPTGAIVVSPLRVPIELGDAVVIRVRRERGEPHFDAAAPNATCRFDRDGQNFALAVPPWGHGYDGPSYVDTRATVLDGGALFRHSFRASRAVEFLGCRCKSASFLPPPIFGLYEKGGHPYVL